MTTDQSTSTEALVREIAEVELAISALPPGPGGEIITAELLELAVREYDAVKALTKQVTLRS